MTNAQLEAQIILAEDETNKGNYDAAQILAQQVIDVLDNRSDDITSTENDVNTKDTNNSNNLSDELHDTTTIRANAILALAWNNYSKGDFLLALEQAHRGLVQAQEGQITSSITKAWNIIGNVHVSLGNYDNALEFFNKALAINEEIGSKNGIAHNLGNLGNVYHNLSDYTQALTFFQKALAINEEIASKNGIAINLGNIGIVYRNLSDYPQALTYYQKALAIYEEIGSKYGIARNLGNIGNVYRNLSDYPQALTYFLKALAISEEIGSKNGIAINLSNIGSVYGNLSDYPQALTYFQKALAISEEIGSKNGIAINLGNIGEHYANKKFDGYDTDKAEESLLRAIALFEDIGEKRNLYAVHKSLADLYETQKRWEEHSIQFKKYHTLEKEVQSEDAHKQAGLMEQRRQTTEREKEIELAKAAAAAKLTATTALLHRVLPESIATRMIAGEQDISDYFTSVTILFADIAGFTPISAGMPAYVVVRFLNYVFGTFDAIMKKHGCEKIKTIGDGYMAVAGAPIECADHAERMALAALEMQQDIRLPEEFMEYLPVGTDFGIRIGLHTGSVVGGVIGDERFVYDIYSDSVNTAARMESHGEADKIHVSHEYMIHIQNRFAMTKNTTHGIQFVKRGEMEIKGKGMMKTYFLERLT
ncbi:MAG: tetratricopeptide repeat protein [Ignavibacteria bacterium]|nr:tetratricopeptide repeat protein [Ignavibacteria bacterium]